MINQKLIAEVESIRSRQLEAINTGIISSAYVGQMRGLTKMALLYQMQEEWQWLTCQLSEVQEIHFNAVI